jgi:hypothetical protein
MGRLLGTAHPPAKGAGRVGQPFGNSVGWASPLHGLIDYGFGNINPGVPMTP